MSTISTPPSIPSPTSVVSPSEPLDPNEGLCLLTRELATVAPVEPTRLFKIPRRHPHMRTAVEYALGLPYNSFNIDDPRNIFQLKADWRQIFIDNRGLLLPSMDLVERIFEEHKATQDITTLYDHAKTFRYRFVPLGPKRIMSIVRTSQLTADDANSDVEEWIKYPFSNLPELESHVYPHWAILNAGKKLHDIENSTLNLLATHISAAYQVPVDMGANFIKMIQAIYERWTKAAVVNTFEAVLVALTHQFLSTLHRFSLSAVIGAL